MNINQFPTNGFQCAEANAALKNFTAFKIGGSCPVLIHATSLEEINHAVELCKELELKLFVLGNGFNVLAADSGFDGVNLP